MSESRAGGIDATPERLLAAVLDASNHALFSCSTDGRIASWNRAAERIVGHAADDIIGSPLVSLFPAHLQPEIERLGEAADAGEGVDRMLVEIERKDGMTIPIALSLRPVAGRDGSLAGYMVVIDDLTETRLAQAALAEVEARFQEWESLAHIGRWLWDVGTDSVQWSNELHRMFGVEPIEFDGTLGAHLACLHPDDRERVRALMQHAVDSVQSFDDVHRVIQPNGTTLWFEVRAEPAINSAGVVVGLRGVSRGRSSSSTGEHSHSLEQV